MELILKLGFDPNAIATFTEMQFSHENATSLVIAAGHGNIKAVELLVENGATIKLKDGYGNTALDYAIKNKKKKIVEFLGHIQNS